MDPCANTDFKYYLLQTDVVSFNLGDGYQNDTLMFSDNYSDFFGESSICG